MRNLSNLKPRDKKVWQYILRSQLARARYALRKGKKLPGYPRLRQMAIDVGLQPKL